LFLSEEALMKNFSDLPVIFGNPLPLGMGRMSSRHGGYLIWQQTKSAWAANSLNMNAKARKAVWIKV